MPKRTKKAKKAKRRMGRPRKYSQSKEMYTVYNRKRPVARLYPGEKQILEYLRTNPEEMSRLKNLANTRQETTIPSS